MKKTLVLIIILLVIIGSGAVFAGNYSVVQTEKEFVLVQKENFDFANFYVDTRDWTAADYIDHPEILSGLVKKGYQDLQKHLDSSEFKQKIDQIGKDLKSIIDTIKDEE